MDWFLGDPHSHTPRQPYFWSSNTHWYNVVFQQRLSLSCPVLSSHFPLKPEVTDREKATEIYWPRLFINPRFFRSCELVWRHLSLSQVWFQAKNAKNTCKCSWSPPFIEDASDGDLVSENASDFPEVIARTHVSQIVPRPRDIARRFLQDAWQERFTQERKYVLIVLQIDKQPWNPRCPGQQSCHLKGWSLIYCVPARDKWQSHCHFEFHQVQSMG